MKRFRILIPVLLDLEIEADDALNAVRAVDNAFALPDPLNSPSVRLGVRSALAPLVRGRLLHATPQGPARLKNESDSRS
jgi:hypothetical protein